MPTYVFWANIQVEYNLYIEADTLEEAEEIASELDPIDVYAGSVQSQDREVSFTLEPTYSGDELEEGDELEFCVGMTVVANRSMGDKMLNNIDTIQDPDCHIMPYENAQVIDEDEGIVVAVDGPYDWQKSCVEVDFGNNTLWVNRAWVTPVEESEEEDDPD